MLAVKTKGVDKHVEPKAEDLRTRVQFPPPPPIIEPQLLSVGVFYSPIAPDPAHCWGFLRKFADFAHHPNYSFMAVFFSLLAIPRSSLAVLELTKSAKAT